MLSNSEKMVNHYGQLLLLVLGTVVGVTPLVLFILPILGIWQLVDFMILWSENGYKKWYIFYLSAILVFILFGIFIGYFFDSEDNNIANLNSMIGFSYYSIIIAWIFLLHWRKK